MTKLDLLARSAIDARDIADKLTRRGVTLSLGSSSYDRQTRLAGHVQHFRHRVRVRFRPDSRLNPRGHVVAKAKGRLRSKQPKRSEHQRKPLLGLVDAGEYTRGEIADRMGVARTTVYREIQRTARPTTS